MKYFLIACIAVLCICNCTKNGNTTTIFNNSNNIQQTHEIKEILADSNNTKMSIQQEDNNKEIVETDVLKENYSSKITDDLKMHLIEYFPNGNYQLFKEILNVGNREIIFAGRCIKHFLDYLNTEVIIYDIIIGFEIIDGTFQRYLLIKDFVFFNADNSILFDFSKDYPGIFGFSFTYSYPKVTGYTPGLVIDTYFDNANRISDSFTIMWNETKKVFEKAIW